MGMKNDALPQIKIASPCHADWGKMTGDERSRFCASCQKNVYNISAMTSKEASDLIREKEGKLCVRYFLRRDGTILTQDCPVGLAAIRKQFLKIAAAFVSMLAMVGLGSGCKKEESRALAGEVSIAPQTQPNSMTQVMGDFAVPPQTNSMIEIKGKIARPPQTNDQSAVIGSPAPRHLMGRMKPSN